MEPSLDILKEAIREELTGAVTDFDFAAFVGSGENDIDLLVVFGDREFGTSLDTLIQILRTATSAVSDNIGVPVSIVPTFKMQPSDMMAVIAATHEKSVIQIHLLVYPSLDYLAAWEPSPIVRGFVDHLANAVETSVYLMGSASPQSHRLAHGRFMCRYLAVHSVELLSMAQQERSRSMSPHEAKTVLSSLSHNLSSNVSSILASWLSDSHENIDNIVQQLKTFVAWLLNVNLGES
jgi:hypothetical protein